MIASIQKSFKCFVLSINFIVCNIIATDATSVKVVKNDPQPQKIHFKLLVVLLNSNKYSPYLVVIIILRKATKLGKYTWALKQIMTIYYFFCLLVLSNRINLS